VKRLISVFIAIFAILALTVPAAADVNGTTTANVASGQGNPPIIKCKWEQEPDNSIILPDGSKTGGAMHLESGDTGHSTPGMQILPPLAKCATKDIQYYAVVTDPQGTNTVTNVFAIVYHPPESPPPYNQSDSAWGNLFKYKVDFVKQGHGTAEINKVNTAYDAGLIEAFGENPDTQQPYTLDEITGPEGEMAKETADLWYGHIVIDYEQPAGEYKVDVYGYDQPGNLGGPLTNYFDYVGVCGIEVDFTSINYGSVTMNFDKIIAGDTTWDDPAGVADLDNRATVRNIGNTWAHVCVAQDDMGFGFVGLASGVSKYVGTSIPSHVSPITNPNTQSTWNVVFDCLVGPDSSYRKWYDPTTNANLTAAPNTVCLDNYLDLSTKEEIDFSILVREGAAPGAHNGCMVLSCAIEPFDPSPADLCGIPDPCE
jgi:hypothetical protein